MAPTPESRPEPQRATDPANDRALARTTHQAFWYGAAQSLPLMIVIIPFGLLFGIVASDAGLGLAQIMGFSVVVLAGASQFTAVQLINEGAPAIVVILTGLVINLRMAMYSASMVPWLRGSTRGQKIAFAYALIDQTYALSIQHYERHPALSLSQRLAYFTGTAVMLCGGWMVLTWFGATLGNAMPGNIPLDFAIPITFLAMIAPMLRTPAHLAACAVAIIAALMLAWMPSGLGMMIAAPLGMATGAMVEVWTERKRG
ncbi:AzlC family ABC transporter permease [Paracoccus sp. (in: a-proteobacteria)]|uniref:AzlC family ABC transporter permease n=1 Tax=Paracoccus sp. TaxID=267 RepID=UPI0026E006D4|nr:AzlC family ABC transporter permease [Paracoccus sp. (in: a-proteobacteria)]MDO5647688.1 AzlC family ABC transporter permease [Paracoccus sp. (in: a-proteobacteria)]